MATIANPNGTVAPVAAAAQVAAPASTTDMYEVISLLGKGSFGTVWRIRRKSDGRIMVWKELNYGTMREKEKQLVVSEVSEARACEAASARSAPWPPPPPRHSGLRRGRAERASISAKCKAQSAPWVASLSAIARSHRVMGSAGSKRAPHGEREALAQPPPSIAQRFARRAWRFVLLCARTRATNYHCASRHGASTLRLPAHHPPGEHPTRTPPSTHRSVL